MLFELAEQNPVVTADDTNDEIVGAYWRQYRLSADGKRSDRLAAADCFWAWEAVEETVSRGGVDAVALIERLANAVDGDEAALAYLGAGSIEDLLRHNGPPSTTVADALDAAARRNPNVRVAVRCVWWSDEDDAALAERFKRFGPPL